MKLDVITPDLRINEVIRHFPSTVSVFNRFGLDSCCGGNRTIAEAAFAHGLALHDVLEALSSPPETV